METMDKIEEINGVMANPKMTLEEKYDYVDTLTEEEMRNMFKSIMTAWASKPV